MNFKPRNLPGFFVLDKGGVWRPSGRGPGLSPALAGGTPAQTPPRLEPK